MLCIYHLLAFKANNPKNWESSSPLIVRIVMANDCYCVLFFLLKKKKTYDWDGYCGCESYKKMKYN